MIASRPMREPPPTRELTPPLTRRRLLLVGAAVPLVSACGEVIDGAPADASDGDAIAADAIAPDATTPDAAPDAPPDARRDVAAEPPGADVSPDRPDAAMDANPDRADASADLALADRVDVPSEARDLGPDTVDVPVDVGPPCGLTDRYLASLAVTAVPSRGGVVDAALRVVVARDAGGLYAMSAVCPHNGCVVEVVSGAATSCPCHGSSFDNNGVRRSGPATRSLIHHPLSVCSGRVYVDPSRSIAVTTRTPAA